MNETQRIKRDFFRGLLTLSEVEARLREAGHTPDAIQAIIYDLIAFESQG